MMVLCVTNINGRCCDGRAFFPFSFLICVIIIKSYFVEHRVCKMS